MKEAIKPLSTLSQAIVTTLVTALAQGITEAKNSGDRLTIFTSAAVKAKFPKTPDEADVVVIVDKLAEKLGWSGTPREKVNKSESRNLVRQHAYLPELMSALRASEYGNCGYADAVTLCRLMKEHGNVKAAVAAFNTKSDAKKADTLKKLASAAKAHYQTVSESRAKDKSAKLAALRSVSEAFGFEIV